MNRLSVLGKAKVARLASTGGGRNVKSARKMPIATITGGYTNVCMRIHAGIDTKWRGGGGGGGGLGGGDFL